MRTSTDERKAYHIGYMTAIRDLMCQDPKHIADVGLSASQSASMCDREHQLVEALQRS